MWDSGSKPKGLFLGHINVCGVMNKTERMESLLTGSNIDISGVSESWLTHSSPTAAVGFSGYNTRRGLPGL